MLSGKSRYIRLLDCYDRDTISWLLMIADEYRRLRKSKILTRWEKYCLFIETGTSDAKRSTLRYWRRAINPLGCMNNPLITPRFVWALASLIGDGSAEVYRHKKRKLDMFVIRLKSKDEDFCENIKEALNDAGIGVTCHRIKKENKHVCVAYGLLMFSILQAVRKETEVAVDKLIRPLLTTPVKKKYFVRGMADAEGGINLKIDDGVIKGYDIYVATNQNKVLIKLVSELLNDLGYPHSITKKTEKCQGIRLRTRDPKVVLRFYEEIGFSIRRKVIDLQRVLGFVKNGSPNPSPLLPTPLIFLDPNSHRYL